MKINNVTATGFGPFRTTQQVDFDAFDTEGLFLISGKTGAGKSSILDAVTFALYGNTPRYDGQSEVRYRSDHAGANDDTTVTVEFTVDDTRYRATRSPEYSRPKQRGDGFTKQAARASLEKLDSSGSWIGLARLPRDVGPMIQEIVGLNAGQFLQVMLLAQNRFQEFLVSDTQNRRHLLQQLFDADRFEYYETKIDGQRKTLEAKASNARAALEANLTQLLALLQDSTAEGDGGEQELPDITYLLSAATATSNELVEWLDEIQEVETTHYDTCKSSADKAEATLETVRHKLREAEEINRLQQKRAAALAILETAKSMAPQCQKWRDTLEANERYQRVAPSIKSANSAQQMLESSVAEKDTAFVDLDVISDSVLDNLDIKKSPLSDLSVARGSRDKLLGSIPALRSALELEANLSELAKTANTLEAKVTENEAVRTELLRNLQRWTVELGEKEEEITEITPLVDSIPTCETKLEEAKTTQVQLAKLDKTRAEAENALAAVKVASEEQITKASEVTALWEKRFRGFAAELAAELEPGLPCRVCGATEHPSPATAVEGEKPVTMGDINQAQVKADQAADHLLQLRQRADQQLLEVTHLEELTEGTSPEAIALALEAATAQLATAKEAFEKRANLQQQVTKLKAQINEAQKRAELLVDTIKQFSAEHSIAKANLAQATDLVANSLGGFESVAARIKSLKDAERAINTYIEAAQAYEKAHNANQRAQHELKGVLAEQLFDSVEMAEAAALTKSEKAELENQLKKIEEPAISARADLADPALQGLTAQQVDLEPYRTVVSEAQNVFNEANATLGAAKQRKELVTSIASNALELHRKTGAAVAEYLVVKRLSDTIRGNLPNEKRMRLIDYVLAAELEQIVAAANVRLSAMRNGRYSLEHTDAKAKGAGQSGLGLQVMDSHTGMARPTQSLSGGEKFLASLALALGLAETVANRAGGITIDTLFIDEGFGSLDDETLEIAMETLDSLRNNGRTVGVISHVGSMHDRIPAKVEVTVTPGGWSEVRQK